MKFNLMNLDNSVIDQIELNPDVFGSPIRYDIMHNIVNWQLAKRRSGNHKVKEVGDVRGSTRKIYKQKGTGRARHGSARAAQFRGGGVIFGPVLRSHSFKINKKVRAIGIRSCLSLKFSQSSLIFLDNINLSSSKTSDLVKKINNMGIASALVIHENHNPMFDFAAKNIVKLAHIPAVGINVYDILRYKTLIITLDALKSIEKRLG